MGYGALIRDGVALAKRITGGADGVLTTVTQRRAAARDGYGDPIGADVVTTYEAIVESKTRTYRTSSGEEAVSQHTVSFLEPVDLRAGDELTAPGGVHGQIIDIGGLMDPAAAGGRFVTVVHLGYRVGG